MKIQIDTLNKVIKLEETVKLKELFEVLDTLFPSFMWKEYSLETNTIINNWTNPIIIDRYVPSPTYPWWQQPYYTTNGSSIIEMDVNQYYNVNIQ